MRAASRGNLPMTSQSTAEARDTAPAASSLLDKADALFDAGRLKQAERAYRKIVSRQPGNTHAQARLASVALDRGMTEDARTALAAALRHAPNEPDLHQLLGRLLAAQGRASEAVGAYASAISLKPDHIAAHQGLAPLLFRQKRYGEARKSATIALKLAPADVSLLLLLAEIESAEGQSEAALAALTKAAQIDDADATVARRLCEVLMDLGKMPEAAVWGNRAYKLAPDEGRVALSYALALDAVRQYREVVNVVEAAVARGRLRPFELAFAENLAARALGTTGRHSEALAHARRAIEAAPDDASYGSTYCRSLRNAGRMDEALSFAQGLHKRNPENIGAAIVHAFATRESGNFAGAEEIYRSVLKADPRRTEARFGMAVIQLSEGRYRDGFANYEARLEPPLEVIRPKPPLEMWDGSEDPNVTLVVLREQGLGDEIQFSRYLGLARERVGHLNYVTFPRMIELLKPVTAGIQVSPDSMTGSKSDGRTWRWLPLMSLPHVLGLADDELPGGAPYLQAAPEAVERMKARIAHGKVRVGIAWQGSPTSQVEAGRSIPLDEFAPLAAVDGVHLYSLQKMHGLEQVDGIGFRDRLTEFGDDFDGGEDAFRDTAGAMMNLDVVVTSDTAVAHLAGALGVRCWVVLQRRPEWRWGMEADRTPWYPKMRLFRQAAPGDWKSAMGQVAAELRKLRPAQPAFSRESLLRRDKPEFVRIASD